MLSCEGCGDCIQQCGCECYDDEECDIPSEVCNCGHRNHEGYCSITICPHKCKLVECHNYRLCGQKCPQKLLNSHNGMCMDCAIMIGRIKFLNENGHCPICLGNKDMIEISCGKHKVCLDCWKTWSETSKQYPLTCPLCRESIWK